MLNITQFYKTLVIGGLLFNSMLGMSLSSLMTKLTKNPQNRPESLIQSKYLKTKLHEPSKLPTKFFFMRCQAKNAISNHLDNIENAQKLKQKLAETTYASIIAELEAKLSMAENQDDSSGSITKATVKCVQIKSFSSRLFDCSNLMSLCSVLGDSRKSFSSEPRAIDSINIKEKLALLEDALCKIDQQLIKNLGYRDQTFAESTATLITSKLKTKLMARQELSEIDFSMLIDEILELINIDYLEGIRRTLGKLSVFGCQFRDEVVREGTFFGILNLCSEPVETNKRNAIKKEIIDYKDALKFIVAKNCSIFELYEIKNHDIASDLWSTIEKKVDAKLCDDFAKKEFVKLSPQEQNELKNKFANSTTHQLVLTNKLLSLTNKLDQWTAGHFKFSDLWFVSSNAYQLYNLHKPKEVDELKSNINLWLTCFREQLAATY
jgi:hypothetical protein